MKRFSIKRGVYLNGRNLQKGFIAGANRLISKHEHLNEINVFPVPDGDTGSNMASTMQSCASIDSKKNSSISDVAKALAESALMGARGNSGAILAQFMCGFSESVKGLGKLSPGEFISAISLAAKRAREAVSKPKDGTILSVIQDWAEYLKANANRYGDFTHLFEDSIGKAKVSLQETREKLAALKAADVVDAGAQGFIYILEGILDFIQKGFEEEQISVPISNSVIMSSYEDITYKYCVECLVEGSEIKKDQLEKACSLMGDSIVVAGTPSLLRVHIHTNEPEDVFTLVKGYGSILQRKVENMEEQHSHFLEHLIPDEKTIQQTVGIVTDSTCDLPKTVLDELGVSTVPLRLILDQHEFIDKKDLSAAEFNKLLVSSAHAKTSQPPAFDFHKEYKKHLEKYENVLSLHMMGLYSGSVQSAVVTSKKFNRRVSVVDTYTLSGGLGLIVASAARYAQQGYNLSELLQYVYNARENVRVFVSMDTLDFAVRGGRISRGSGIIAKFLHIKPVLEFATRNRGRADVVAKAVGSKHCEKRLLDFIGYEARTMNNLRFVITHVNALETAQRYAEVILHRIRNSSIEYVMDASAVLGVHSGPGACAVSFLGEVHV